MNWASPPLINTPSRRNIVGGLLAALCVLTSPLSVAQNTSAASMVSVKGSTLNMRSGPGTQNAVIWELKRGYPLQVIKRQGQWLNVRDFEGDTGWVSASLTERTPHHVVKSRVANVRSSPSTQGRIVGKAAYGDLVRTRETRAGWVRIERSNGPNGWISKNLLWGW